MSKETECLGLEASGVHLIDDEGVPAAYFFKEKDCADVARILAAHEGLVAALEKALVCLKPLGRPEREGDDYYEIICEIRAALAAKAP